MPSSVPVGRHADVGEHDVGLGAVDRGHELVVVGAEGHDLDVVLLVQELGHSLPHEERVLGDDQTEGHGRGVYVWSGWGRVLQAVVVTLPRWPAPER